jgi:hypothetical protein
MGPALLLAVVFGAGRIAIPESALRFPDPMAALGSGVGKEANMLESALRDSGLALRGGGPGPQQLAARWAAGQLNEAEKLAVLLGGGVFHDPVLLGAYADALQSGNLRLRQAAAVGFFRLVGLPAPLPSRIPDDPASWRRLRGMVLNLGFITETRPLVRVLVDSYYAGKGVRRPELFAFRRDGMELLRAIREIAQPADLQDVLAVWPALETFEERGVVMGTVEMLSLQHLVNRSPDPHQPSGDWLVKAAIASVDQWVATMCQSPDGELELRQSLERNRLLGRDRRPGARTWFALMTIRYWPFLPLSADRLMDITGMAFPVDRQTFDNPVNQDTYKKLLEAMPVSSWFPPPQQQQQRRR